MNKRARTWIVSALFAAIALAGQRASAADVRLKSGSLAFLKQQKNVNLEFDYSAMKVGRKAKEAVPEAEFIARLNQKQPGHGDAWKREWIGTAPNYQNGFQELLNKQLEGGSSPLQFGAFKQAKYTLLLKTTTLVTGTEGFAPAPPAVSADAIFVETGNRSSVLATVELERMPGGSAWYFAMREAYAKAGKDLGIFLRRKVN
jgi:hypothetical protein